MPPPLPLWGARLTGRDVVLTLALGIAIFAVAFLFIQELGDDASSPAARRNYWIAYMAAEVFAFLAALYLVLGLGRRLRLSDLGYVPAPPRWALRGAAAGFLALPLAFFLHALLRSVTGSETSTAIQQLLGSDVSLLQAGTLLLYGGVLVPIVEEFVFRGVLFGWLRQRFAFMPAALLSSAVFGAFHVRPEAAIVTGAIGFVLAWLYEKSRSIVPAILMHQVYNSLTFLLSFAAAGRG
jgi:membrane protease YdiL (CAAX protease family)